MRRKTAKIKAIEERYGERMETLLPRMINEAETQSEVAEEWGLSKATFGYWTFKQNIRIKQAAIPPGYELVLRWQGDADGEVIARN